MKPADLKFSRLRMRVAHPSAAHFEVREGGPHREQKAEENGIIAHLLATRDPRADKAARLWAVLVARDAEMMAWIEKDAGHALLFAYDPLAAVKQALPDIPAYLLTP
jgi:hypothetical protein